MSTRALRSSDHSWLAAERSKDADTLLERHHYFA